MSKTPDRDIPQNRKFGYEHVMLRKRIREHLIRRGHDPHALEFEFRVTHIQDRINRYKPTMRERQDAARKAQAQKIPPRKSLTEDEWRYLEEHFDGANHPLAISIRNKAAMRRSD